MRVGVVVGMSASLLIGCGEPEGGGFVMLEYDRGFEVDGQALEFLSASVQFTKAPNGGDPTSLAATHGAYGKGGLLTPGSCVPQNQLAQAVLEPVDVGANVEISSSAGTIVANRVESSYAVDSPYAPFVSPELAVLDTDWTVSVSGSDAVAAGALDASLHLPRAISGGIIPAFLAGTTSTLKRGESFDITWDKFDDERVEQIFVRFHAPDGSSVTVCLGDDTGKFTIPASVVDQQMANGTIAVGYLARSETELFDRSIQLIGSSCAFGLYTIAD
jgi:hypothetical protein